MQAGAGPHRAVLPLLLLHWPHVHAEGGWVQACVACGLCVLVVMYCVYLMNVCVYVARPLWVALLTYAPRMYNQHTPNIAKEHRAGGGAGAAPPREEGPGGLLA